MKLIYLRQTSFIIIVLSIKRERERVRDMVIIINKINLFTYFIMFPEAWIGFHKTQIRYIQKASKQI